MSSRGKIAGARASFGPAPVFFQRVRESGITSKKEGGCSTNLGETLRLWYTTHWLEVSYDCGVFFHRAASFEETLL
jgi:hypothetical protein